MAIDKKTIGITKANSGTLGAIQVAGKFASELDAAKFSMAFAIKTGTAPGSADGAETKWNVGSVDPDGSLRSLLEGLFPSCAEPYRFAEYLMNEGIRQLGVAINEGGDLYDMIFPAR
jgi:hypothetical protein